MISSLFCFLGSQTDVCDWAISYAFIALSGFFLRSQSFSSFIKFLSSIKKAIALPSPFFIPSWQKKATVLTRNQECIITVSTRTPRAHSSFLWCDANERWPRSLAAAAMHRRRLVQVRIHQLQNSYMLSPICLARCISRKLLSLK